MDMMKRMLAQSAPQQEGEMSPEEMQLKMAALKNMMSGSAMSPKEGVDLSAALEDSGNDMDMQMLQNQKMKMLQQQSPPRQPEVIEIPDTGARDPQSISPETFMKLKALMGK